MSCGSQFKGKVAQPHKHRITTQNIYPILLHTYSQADMPVQTVGIVGTGVIGASWTGLFLAYGLHVVVADPAPGAEEKLASFLENIWPTLETMGLRGE